MMFEDIRELWLLPNAVTAKHSFKFKSNIYLFLYWIFLALILQTPVIALRFKEAIYIIFAYKHYRETLLVKVICKIIYLT